MNFLITFNSGESLEYAKKTYRVAAQLGGEIHATHMLQHRVNVEGDIAIQTLTGSVHESLKLTRVFLFTNKGEEEAWMQSFFSIAKPPLEVEAVFWRGSAVARNPRLLSLIPRFNLLLYRSADRKVYRSLIGFERVRSRSTWTKPNLNIGITSESAELYDALRDYYESIIIHPEMSRATELEAYFEQQAPTLLSPDEQHIVSTVVDYAYRTPSVLQVGAFGRTALMVNNISKVRRRANHVADVDLLLIVENGKQQVKNDLAIALHNINSNVELIFGDDDTYFYHFRPPGKHVVELEIFERDAMFYSRHKLLGYSIFENYVSLFTAVGLAVDELIEVPREPIAVNERINLFLNDRKGIREFVRRLRQPQDSKNIDPRRVLTINLQNIAWAITGLRAPSVETSLKFLRKEKLLEERILQNVDEIIDLDYTEIVYKYEDVIKRTSEILEAIGAIAEAELRVGDTKRPPL